MYKTIAMMIICALFLVSQNTYALNLNLQSIDQKLSEATLIDRDTGDTWIAMEGDYIGDWRVTEINENSVKIRKEAAGDMEYHIIRTLLLPKKMNLMPVH